MNILGREVAIHVAFFPFHNLREISAYMRRDARRKKYRHRRNVQSRPASYSSLHYPVTLVLPEALSSLRYSVKRSGFHQNHFQVFEFGPHTALFLLSHSFIISNRIYKKNMYFWRLDNKNKCFIIVNLIVNLNLIAI